jgi:murein DD-endopeptidase MepM/ murein hydrolase activator NlpD
LSAKNLATMLTIYVYTPTKSDTFPIVAAAAGIPSETLATLNRLQNNRALPTCKNLLLPSMPGIFIATNPKTPLERLIAASRGDTPGVLVHIPTGDGVVTDFRFIPGDTFTPNERFFFMEPGMFMFPLERFRVTSEFGSRISPISHRRSFHAGVDLAAPNGVVVRAAADGVVITVAKSPVYGNYIILKHNNAWTTLYGHLSKTTVHTHQHIQAGDQIGNVGSTGESTGPHLHFEVRQNGKPQDPQNYFRTPQEKQ